MTSQAGGIEIQKAGEIETWIQALLWGPPGAGKTTLACTAPGKKLLINFDPNGHASVAFRSDVDVLDFSGKGAAFTNEFKNSDPFGVSKVIGPYDTLLIDSLSSVQELTTKQGIEFAKSQGIKANIENPSMNAFQARNNLMLELVRNMLAVARNHGKHIIFIAHEAAADRDKEGNIIGIPILLGGQLPTNVGVKLSEIWPMYDLDNGKKKFIAIRPARMRTVAKSRMFLTNGSPEFHWKFDPEKPDDAQVQHTIAGWHEQWIKNGKRKIPLPT